MATKMLVDVTLSPGDQTMIYAKMVRCTHVVELVRTTRSSFFSSPSHYWSMSSTPQQDQSDLPVALRLLGTSLAACLLASICVVARLWFRYRISRLGTDDLFILAAMVINLLFHNFSTLLSRTDTFHDRHDSSTELPAIWRESHVQIANISFTNNVLFLRYSRLGCSNDQDLISFHAFTLPSRKSLESGSLHLDCHSGNVSFCFYINQLFEMYARSESMGLKSQ